MSGYEKRQAWLKTFRWLFINIGDLALVTPLIMLGILIWGTWPGWEEFAVLAIASFVWYFGFHAMAVLVDLWIDD